MFKKLPHLPYKVYRIENTFLLKYFWKNFFFTTETCGAPRKKLTRFKIMQMCTGTSVHNAHNFKYRKFITTGRTAGIVLLWLDPQQSCFEDHE
jgi:hypothetical protein